MKLLVAWLSRARSSPAKNRFLAIVPLVGIPQAVPRLHRREIVSENQIGVFPCIQRAFLRGFDHRMLWVQNRLRQLASLFGIDVCE